MDKDADYDPYGMEDVKADLRKEFERAYEEQRKYGQGIPIAKTMPWERDSYFEKYVKGMSPTKSPTKREGTKFVKPNPRPPLESAIDKAVKELKEL